MAADWRMQQYPKAHGRACTPVSRGSVAVARATENSEKSDGNGRSARVFVASFLVKTENFECDAVTRMALENDVLPLP